MNSQLPKTLNLGDFIWFSILLIFCCSFCYYFIENWGIVGSLLVACLLYSAFIHLFFQGKILRLYNAHEIWSTDKKDYQELHVWAKELSLAAGVKTPKIHVYESEMPNAFAISKGKNNGSIAVASCLFTLLDQKEQRAVIGHELAHIINRDSLSTSICQAFGNIITVQFTIMKFITRFLITRKHWFPRLLGLIFTGSLLILLIASIFSEFLINRISKRREYRADMTGSFLTHDPNSLATAINKMETESIALWDKTNSMPTAIRRIHTVNPMSARPYSDMHVFEKIYFELKCTHPPSDKRIEKLEALSNQLDFSL